MSNRLGPVHDHQRSSRRAFPPSRETVLERRRWPAPRAQVSSQAGNRSALQGLRAIPRILPRRQRSRSRRIASNRLDRPCGKTASAKEYVGKENDRTQAGQGRCETHFSRTGAGCGVNPLSADKRFFNALIASDTQALGRILTDDFILIDVMSGSEITK